MDGRVFTLAEANALVPRLRPLLVALREAWHRFSFARDQCRELAAAGDGTSGEAVHWRGEAEAHGADVARLLDEVRALGAEVKDPTMGLADFPARRRDGTLVLLCYRDDEDAIAHWHPLDAGFVGRRPSAEL